MLLTFIVSRSLVVTLATLEHLINCYVIINFLAHKHQVVGTK